MPELRWILIVFGLGLLVGIYVWGRRKAKPTAVDEATVLPARSDPVFEPASSYDQFDAPLVDPIEDTDAGVAIESDRSDVQAVGREARVSRYTAVEHESEEPTIEARVERSARDSRTARIEPTFAEETETAELPVGNLEPNAAVPFRPQATTEAPTLSMSTTPAPRRIERRKIIALRLAAGGQRLAGAQLKSVLESESLQHGKYDVFHKLDSNGASIFSVASMMEPGTFNLEKMPQEMFPGVTLFTQLPGPVAGMLAFNELIACSRRLHAALGGTLQDERGVPLTVHRIERIRQEIREFEQRPTGDATRSSPSFSPTP